MYFLHIISLTCAHVAIKTETFNTHKLSQSLAKCTSEDDNRREQNNLPEERIPELWCCDCKGPPPDCHLPNLRHKGI